MRAEHINDALPAAVGADGAAAPGTEVVDSSRGTKRSGAEAEGNAAKKPR